VVGDGSAGRPSVARQREAYPKPTVLEPKLVRSHSANVISEALAEIESLPFAKPTALSFERWHRRGSDLRWRNNDLLRSNSLDGTPAFRGWAQLPRNWEAQ
jgi:hypothetical protein